MQTATLPPVFRSKVIRAGPENDLSSQIDRERLPQHIAIIMDGNGRWAQKRKLPRIAGHRAGMRAVRQGIEACSTLGISFLTLYAFSVENWKRPHSEVKLLMALLREYVKKELEELDRRKIRLAVIGRIRELPLPVQRDLQAAIDRTRHNKGLQVTLALNYGARTEIVDAFREIIKELKENGALEVDERAVSRRLYTQGIPDPDLLIRTSGEMRLSNFLLWQAAYAEIWITDTLWPDFTRRDLFQAVLDFQKRERRYGGLTIG
jgi:undecaprenyl diphosphate synthase